jgi:Protein of unknown function with PCYCGC motif
MIEKRIVLPMLITALTVVLTAQAPAPANRTATNTLAPHPRANLPALHIPDIDARLLPRPPEVIRSTYQFAAEHPEVLSYVPCFCGCDQSGHRSSEDCFVKSRAKNGDVSEWNEHGIACAMCLAVAERAKQMCDKGASLTDVRADIEQRYGHITGSRTATPLPPK